MYALREKQEKKQAKLKRLHFLSICDYSWKSSEYRSCTSLLYQQPQEVDQKTVIPGTDMLRWRPFCGACSGFLLHAIYDLELSGMTQLHFAEL